MILPFFLRPGFREGCYRRQRNRQLRIEQLEGRQVLAASMSGAVFSDVNADGVFQPGAGETALAGRRVYIDANANGRFDSATEASDLTAANGTYSIGNLAAGNYRLVLEGQVDWEQTTPLGPSNMWVTQGISLYEYTRSGQLVRILPVEAPPGGRRDGYFGMKDVTVDHSGRIHVLQGDYQLAYISTFTPSTGTWEHHISPELWFYGNVNNGELSTEGDFLYLGLRRYNLLDWSSTLYTLDPFPVLGLSDFRMGLNGKLYSWSSSSPQYQVYEFNPATYVIEREFPLRDENNILISMWGLAVDAAGDLYAADINGRTYHYSPTGVLIGFQKLHNSYPSDLDLSTDGWLASGHRLGNAGSMSVDFTQAQVFTVGDSVSFTAFTTYQGSGSSSLPHFVTLAVNENKVQLDFGTHKEGPLAVDDAYSLDEDATLDVVAADGVLANDLGLPLSVTLLDDVQQGTLTLRVDGSFTYAPVHDFNGLDSFAYQVTDSQDRTATGTVSLTVRPVNDPPTANDDVYDVNAYCNGYVLQVLINDSVAPEIGEILEITQLGPLDQGGSAAIRADGKTILYEPAPGFSGEETFTYVAGDGLGGFDVATVTIQVIHSWQNVWRALDVDGDFHVVPLDVLLIINEINAAGSHELGLPPHERVDFLDVNGDGHVSPGDALEVINELNDGPPSEPEGEADSSPVVSGWEGLVLLLAEDVAAQRKR